MRKHLYVDNVDLATYGVYISGGGTFSAPEKEYTWLQVPNRNGDVLGYNRRLLNIKVTYDCFICTNFDTNIANLRSFLLSRNGFVRISDDYHTGEFRKGVYEGPFEPTITKTLDAGSFTLSFVCQPQRWLTSGDTAITGTTTAKKITNPTRFNAQPLIKLANGSYNVNGKFAMRKTNSNFGYGGDLIIEVLSTYGYHDIYIDAETMNAYAYTTIVGFDPMQTPVNEYVSFQYEEYWYGHGFETRYAADAPILYPGDNYVKVLDDSNIATFEITPRWWEV